MYNISSIKLRIYEQEENIAKDATLKFRHFQNLRALFLQF